MPEDECWGNALCTVKKSFDPSFSLFIRGKGIQQNCRFEMRRLLLFF